MKLLEITLKGFGRLRNAHFSFHPEINIIFGPNEAGKSTLQQAIIALLYGFYDANRALNRERELHEQYRPWASSSVATTGHAFALPRESQIKISASKESLSAPARTLTLATTTDVAFAEIAPAPDQYSDVSPTATFPPAVAAVVGLPDDEAGADGSRTAPGREYNGSLKYSLDDGKTLLIHRDFGSEDVPAQLLDAVTGEDWMVRYRRGPALRGKVDFMEKQIGMSRQVFLATACVQQGALRLPAERDAGAVSDAILRLLDSAGADHSAEVAIEHLEKKLRELGSPDRSGQKALLPQARLQLEELRETHALRLATQRAIQDDIEKAEVLELELDELRATLATLEIESLRLQLTQIEDRLQRWQENERRCENLAGEIAALAPYQNFPVEDKEWFFQLWHDFAHYDKLNTMQIDEREAITEKLMELTEKSKTLQVPEETWTKSSLEDFLALHSRWETTFQAILNSENARYDTDEALKKAGLDDVERAAFAALDSSQIEEYRTLETEVKEVEAEVKTAREKYNRFQVDTQRRRRIAGLMAFVALIALTTGFLNTMLGDSNDASAWDNTMLALSLLGMALFIVLNIRWIAHSRELGAHLLEVEDRYMEQRPQLHEVLTRYRVSSIDELVQRKMQFAELGTVAQTHLQLTQEMSKIERDLTPWMTMLGIGHIAPETLQAAEKRLRESHQLWNDISAAQQRLAQIDEKQKEINQNLQRLAGELKAILRQAGIAEPVGEKAYQSYSTACQKREYWETLRIQLQQAETLGKEMLAGETPKKIAGTISRLREELQSMEAGMDVATAATPSPTSRTEEMTTAKRFPVREISLAELQEQRETIQEEIHGKEQKVVALRERVATRLQGLPPLAEIEEEIALVEAEVKRLENAREALELARDYVAQAAQQLHRDFAPRLNNFLGRYLDQLTAGRYTSAMVDPADFSVRLQGPAISSPVELTRLSFGTVEQVYLLLRAAVAEFFTESHESIPLLLDDPLVHADAERMMQALYIIDALAGSHQIFYFTKDPVVLDYFRGKPEGCAIINLEGA
jgi:uncharacterized protein YhaN